MIASPIHQSINSLRRKKKINIILQFILIRLFHLYGSQAEWRDKDILSPISFDSANIHIYPKNLILILIQLIFTLMPGTSHMYNSSLVIEQILKEKLLVKVAFK